ncbi:MAG: Fic family protein [Lentisphaeria bacterium]|nr:Fic family protein [Lentisphaeria bacterium]NQZ70650.1 Fic family protein [Lentisphaeria bacterium]
MPTKPFQSILKPHESEINQLRSEGITYRKIAELLNQKHALSITHNAVYSFCNAKSRIRKNQHRFDENLDPDLREGLHKQIINLWTHNSNAIEGNTLTLGETADILELGLTVSGKPLKDHQEVYGHAKAIQLIHNLLDKKSLDVNDIFTLHTAIMPKMPMDSLNPIGNWKRDYNGTSGVVGNETRYMEYASPGDVPLLMKQWLKEFNKLNCVNSSKKAIKAYSQAHMSFVRIHPFFDGNGRLARLLANIPVLRGGYPPILISVDQRASYIKHLWDYQSTVGELKQGQSLVPKHNTFNLFLGFIKSEWSTVMHLVKEAENKQKKRQTDSERNGNG